MRILSVLSVWGKNMRNWTEHGCSRLTAISDAGSTPAASTSLRPLRGLRLGMPPIIAESD